MPETDILVAPPDREMQTGAPGLCWLEGCRKRRVIPIAMTTSVQRRALRLLADAQHGRTVANMLAHGFTNALLDRLARDGRPRSSRERYAPVRGELPSFGW